MAAPDPAARKAAAAIRAEWDLPLAGPAGVAACLRAHPAAGEGWQRPVDEPCGDTGAALAAAAVRVQASYTTAYLAHVPLETRAAVAQWEDGRLTVWTGNKVPFGVRSRLAAELGVAEDDVRVIVPPTGGGFGGKHIEAARLRPGRPGGRHFRRHCERVSYDPGYPPPEATHRRGDILGLRSVRRRVTAGRGRSL